MKITTNKHLYELMYYQGLTAKELKQFSNWSVDKLGNETFIRYKGKIYVLSEFEDCKIEHYKGVYRHNEFSGVLLRLKGFSQCQIASYTVDIDD